MDEKSIRQELERVLKKDPNEQRIFRYMAYKVSL